MRVTDKIAARQTFSFEIFPPKGELPLEDVLGLLQGRLRALDVVGVELVPAGEPVPEEDHHPHEALDHQEEEDDEDQREKHLLRAPSERLSCVRSPSIAKGPVQDRPSSLHGAGYGVRTRDLHLGKVARYQLR